MISAVQKQKKTVVYIWLINTSITAPGKARAGTPAAKEPSPNKHISKSNTAYAAAQMCPPDLRQTCKSGGLSVRESAC